jgi:hypothetical protein
MLWHKRRKKKREEEEEAMNHEDTFKRFDRKKREHEFR